MQSDGKQRGQRRIRGFLWELSWIRKTDISFERNSSRSRPWHFFLRQVFRNSRHTAISLPSSLVVSFHRKLLHEFYIRTFLDEIIECNSRDYMELIWQDISCLAYVYSLESWIVQQVSTKIWVGAVMSAVNDLIIHRRNSQ